MNSIVRDGKIQLVIDKETISGIDNISIVACGSAWHAGVASQYVIEDLSDIPVRVELASEFKYRNPKLSKSTLVFVISQSGDTADTLAALRLTKEKGVKTLAIINVVVSSIARKADYVFYTVTGLEIAVATTKAFSAQLIAGYCLATEFGRVKGLVDETNKYYIEELETIPAKIESILKEKERIQWFASKIANKKDIFFIGHGIDYAVSLEGSLKLKEISYIHSEAYAAGELKHSMIPLIDKGTLVIGVLTQYALFEKSISNMVVCKSRGAYFWDLLITENTQLRNSVISQFMFQRLMNILQQAYQ